MRGVRATVLRVHAASAFQADSIEQSLHRIRDLGHGRVECSLIRPRRLAIPAHFSHELQRRRRNFVAGRRLIRSSKHFDAAAHISMVKDPWHDSSSVAFDRFELLELRRDDGIQTFHAREISTARPVQVHVFAMASAEDSMALLARINRLPDAERRRVIDRGVSQGKPYVVTDRLAGFASLREWLEAKASQQSPAAPSIDEQFFQLFDSDVPEPPVEAVQPPKSGFTPLVAMALGIAAALIFLVLVLAAIAFRPR
jgi:hypothetical protein